MNLVEKILQAHLVSGTPVPGEEIGIRIDQTLTQDATGTMAYLQFESYGVDAIRVETAVSYIDHNTLQQGFENADDHRYLQSIAARYGLWLSRAGNGICHQVHLERFGIPGKTLIGSDSHTPTAGGLGLFAVGVGGQEVARALAGDPFHLACPQVLGIELTGALPPWVGAKDVILAVLRRLSSKGNVGWAIEYRGAGVATLSVPERATIANMGAETGVTTSVFPSDAVTRRFLADQGRPGDWRELGPDREAAYARELTIDLAALEPLAAAPHNPANITPVAALAGTAVQQVCLGSCTNGSYADLALAAAMLRGRRIHPEVSLVVAPGSRRVLDQLARSGALADLVGAGARLAETACGFCIGSGHAPASGSVSLRTSNRNFAGRSGTADAAVYLVSPATAVAAALAGAVTDPRTLGAPPAVPAPAPAPADDRLLLAPLPPAARARVEIRRGPNIGPPPAVPALPETLAGEVLLRVGDLITTDDIMPAGARLKYRSNIPKYAAFVFEKHDPEFAAKALALKTAGTAGFVVGGLSYGQGSSREHAAICPMYLGVRAVLARSFERIHAANLVNFGIVPVVIGSDAYDALAAGTALELPGIREAIGSGETVARLRSGGREFAGTLALSARQRLRLVGARQRGV